MEESVDARLARAFLAAPNGMIVVDRDGVIVATNRRAAEFMRCHGQDLLGNLARDMVDPADLARNLPAMSRLWREPGATVTMQMALRDVDGNRLPAEIKASHDPVSGDVVMYIEDLHDRLQVQARLETLSRYDAITGLPNRRSILDQIGHHLADASPARPCAVLAVDVDRFQAVNDLFGQEAGDWVLATLGERLGSVVGHADVGRLGADEFVAVVPDVPDAAAAFAIARQLQDAASQGMSRNGVPLRLTVTVGIALAGEPVDPASLIQRAEIALHRARAAGRSADLAESADVAEAVRDLRLETALQAAVHDDDLDVAFQPLIDMAGEVVAVEALVRWPGSGVSAGQIIEAGERAALIVRVGEWVLDHALAALPALSAAAGRDLRLNINWSTRQLNRGGLVETIRTACDRHGLDPSRVCVELTETAAMLDQAATVQTLRDLAALGVRVAVDDFGMGYSSFAYLRDLPVDEVKLDRTFVQRAGTDASAADVLDGMSRLCRGLGLDVVGEGVENSHELELVRNAGCTYWQGYLGARPMAASELVEKLAAWPDRMGFALGSDEDAAAADADERDVLQAVRGLLRYDGSDVAGALAHLLAVLVDALGCDVGVAWTAETGAVGHGLAVTDAVGAALARSVSRGGQCVQHAVADDLPGDLVRRAGIRSWFALPLHGRDGAVLVAHTGDRDFSGIAQRLARTVLESSDVLFNSASAKERLRREAAQAATEARTDGLTGLLNRTGWEEAVDHRRQVPAPTGVVICDANGFKALNDTLGHASGDRLLRRIAGQIARCTPPGGVSARLGGDEFGVLVPGAADDVLAGLAHRLREALTMTVPETGGTATVAVGTALAIAGDDVDAAIVRADAAMYAAKASRGPRSRRVGSAG